MKKIIKSEDEFKKFQKIGKYQVFVFYSKMPFPFSFASHVWFVISNAENNFKRIDGGDFGTKDYIHTDILKPWQGMIVSIYSKTKKRRCNVRFWKKLEGNKNSKAYRLYKLLNGDIKDYPYLKKYRLWPGPNSNTFVSWILEKTNIKIKLPWNAFGKKFREDRR